MKKKLLVLSAAVISLFSLSSCDEIIKELLRPFDAPISEFQISIPVVTNTTSEITLGASQVSFNLDSAIRATSGGNVSINAINSVTVKKIDLNLTNANQLNNLGNFESLKINFSSNSITTPVTIANATVNGEYDSKTIDVTNSPDLKSSLSNGSQMTFTLLGKARSITTQPLTARVNVTLRIE
jgi:hypothetical protein